MLSKKDLMLTKFFLQQLICSHSFLLLQINLNLGI